MNLQSRVLILYLCIAILVMVLIGGVLPASLHKQNLNTISENSIDQLRHIDFALSNFIGSVKADVLELSINDDVRNPDDAGFTNFLNASEETFRYSISDREQQIIDTFQDYQTTHPYVNSVYMGRENGAFVRSYPRARPTAYDPRERPWYILAKEHPGQVSVTDPYQAVTTTDVNIGIVTPLTYPNGTLYGVVGADITLVNLTNYISRFNIGHDGEMILVDKNGMILASRNSSLLFGNISDILQDQTPVFLTMDEGVLVLNGSYLIYFTSPELGWKIGEIIPFSTIEREINNSIVRILLFVILALILLSVITLIALNYTVIQPLTSLTQVSRKIAETGDLDQTIETGGTGEIGSLSRSFKAMVEKILAEQQGREKALAELKDHRDHLEEIIYERTRELSEANTRLQELDRLKSMFIASMSHELRTPLNSIIGFTGIMMKGMAGEINAEQKKQLGMVQESARHLLALINDVIDISKIEAGKIEAGISTFNIADVIREVGNTFGPAAQEQGLVLNVEIPGPVSVTSDERRIKQIIMNLVSNAIKFTDEGRIDVTVEQKGTVVEVRVRDTGIGIGKEELDQLFHPFGRIAVPGRLTEGAGLGLYLSKKLARFLGGDITAESELQKGSVFTFSFPVTYEDQEDI
jgi:signal transduction histidine kinase